MTHVRAQFCNAAGDRCGHYRRGQPGLGNQAQAVSSKRLDKISDYARHGYAIYLLDRRTPPGSSPSHCEGGAGLRRGVDGHPLQGCAPRVADPTTDDE